MDKNKIKHIIEQNVDKDIKNNIDGSEVIGLKLTKSALDKSKNFNKEYYSDVEKKFKDYPKLDVKDNQSPKVNMEDSEKDMYYGTGMEGLKYDDEGTIKHEKFVERNKKLNEPNKNYYAKDEDKKVYDSMIKAGEKYKKHKYEKPDEYQKTPKVRITTENKVTMKRLISKKPFLSEEKTLNSIPDKHKINGNIFEMTDGVETYKIRWEGTKEQGKPVVLLHKNINMVSEEVSKMKRLFSFNSKDTMMKTNDYVTEGSIFRDMLNKTRSMINEQNAPQNPTPQQPGKVNTSTTQTQTTNTTQTPTQSKFFKNTKIEIVPETKRTSLYKGTLEFSFGSDKVSFPDGKNLSYFVVNHDTKVNPKELGSDLSTPENTMSSFLTSSIPSPKNDYEYGMDFANWYKSTLSKENGKMDSKLYDILKIMMNPEVLKMPAIKIENNEKRFTEFKRGINDIMKNK